MAYILLVLLALGFFVVQHSHVLGAATRSVELTSIGLVLLVLDSSLLPKSVTALLHTLFYGQ